MTNPLAHFRALNDFDVSDEEFARAMLLQADQIEQSVGTLADQISVAVASAFIEESLGYDDAGSLVDSVYRAFLQPTVQARQAIPALTLEVYEAFGRGEYLNPDHDTESDDPVEKYTRPILKALLQRIGAKTG